MPEHSSTNPFTRARLAVEAKERTTWAEMTPAEEAFERIARDQGTFSDRVAVRAALARLAAFEQSHADLTRILREESC